MISKCFFLVLIFAVLIAGCDASSEKTKPTVVQDESTIKEVQESSRAVAPKLRCRPCIWSPEEWGTENDRVEIHPDTFWVEDRPRQLEPVAFGVLSHFEHQVPPFKIHQFELVTDFPDVPDHLPVYMQGSYPKEHKELLKKYVDHPELWEYHPAYSLLFYVGVEPISGKIAPTEEKLEKKAVELLGKLLMPDTKVKRTIRTPDGNGWIVIFERKFNDYAIYSDKPLIVHFDADGRAIGIQMRRKPILEASLYPVRRPEEAWELLKNGKWKNLYITDLLPPLEGNIDKFVVKEIEIGYHEQHPSYPKMPLQPYYIFRNEKGQALYVPAIEDPFVEW